MGIFDMFINKSKREDLSHIKVLLALALADGKIDKAELAAIAAVCQREHISESELKRCLENPDSIEFEQPKDHETKVKYLRDMVCIMMADGDIDKNEFVLCKLTAETLGFRHEVIDAMILDIISDLKRELDKL